MIAAVRTGAVLFLLALLVFVLGPYLQDIIDGKMTFDQLYQVVKESKYWTIIVGLVIGLVALFLLQRVVSILITVAIIGALIYFGGNLMGPYSVSALVQKQMQEAVANCNPNLSWDFVENGSAIRVDDNNTIRTYSIDIEGGSPVLKDSFGNPVDASGICAGQ